MFSSTKNLEEITVWAVEEGQEERPVLERRLAQNAGAGYRLSGVETPDWLAMIEKCAQQLNLSVSNNPVIIKWVPDPRDAMEKDIIIIVFLFLFGPLVFVVFTYLGKPSQ